MRKVTVVAILGAFALALAGCGKDGGEDSAPAKAAAAAQQAQLPGTPPDAKKLASALAELGYGSWPVPHRAGAQGYRISVLGKGVAAKQFSALLGNYGRFEITVAGAAPTAGMPTPVHVKQYPGQVTVRWWPWTSGGTAQSLRWSQLDELVAGALKKA